MPLEDADMVEEMTAALGEAVVKCWSEFPPAVQHMLFEAAARDENGFRGALALFLHDHNPQTADFETTDLPPNEDEALPPLFPPGRPRNREPRR
ncbi:MAG TPA: hypothetical protein VFC54_10305 [Pseudolabrys sp.]|nr:hypothetical protein [Pseudolabrys sp.]